LTNGDRIGDMVRMELSIGDRPCGGHTEDRGQSNMAATVL
jgi:hypothetical protein